MNLHIETGHPVMANVKQVESDQVRFVDEDGRCVFEVRILKGQAMIEVRAVDTHKVNGVIHDGLLCVTPRASNNIHLSTPPYAS